MHRIWNAVTPLVLCAIFSPGVSVAQSANKELTKLKKELTQVAKNVGNYAAQLEKTMKSLEGITLSDTKNLQKAYKAFQNDANKLDKAFKTASTGMRNMKAKRDQYFTAWEKSSASISIPELKQASEERRKQVMEEHAKFTEETAGLGNQIDAFMSKLGDLQKFLGSDLSPAAVTAAKPTIDGVLADGRPLASRVQELANRLSGFAGGL